MKDDLDSPGVLEFGLWRWLNSRNAQKRSFSLSPDGVFIGVNLLKTRSGSEPRVFHPIILGFGWIPVLTTHQSSGRGGQEMVIPAPHLQAIMGECDMNYRFGSEEPAVGVRIRISNPTRINPKLSLYPLCSAPIRPCSR